VESKTEVNEERLDAEMEAMQQMMEDKNGSSTTNGTSSGSRVFVRGSVVMCRLVTFYTLTL
jgi:hypothetical protein